MNVEKLTQGELNRIEKYIEEVVRDKISRLRDGKEAKEQEEKKIKENKELQKLCRDYTQLFEKSKAIADKYNLKYSNYDAEASFSLSYDWKNPQEKINKVKIEEIGKLHKELKECMIFKGKPEILKAIQQLEKI